MKNGARADADRLFQEAVEASGARDPRDFYRKALRELKEASPEEYDRAVSHFQTVLVPTIASGEAEPLGAWREYGRLIAELTGPGRTVEIDGTGRALPYSPDSPLDRLVLHIPNVKGMRAILVSLPPTPSLAQRATFELLVRGKQRVPA
ncbi:MAG: hypothetical protein KAJ42_03985, partial [Gemmatimonadetes bacterium]|nr:hypothetical protein [Gemmatimonadota bacterium]